MSANAQGAIGGAASGAAVGTMVLPGIGTAIGAVAGGLLGAFGGGGHDNSKDAINAQLEAVKDTNRTNIVLGALHVKEVTLQEQTKQDMIIGLTAAAIVIAVVFALS